ncbi:sensor histidine kinase [soil metagenome]
MVRSQVPFAVLVSAVLVSIVVIGLPDGAVSGTITAWVTIVAVTAASLTLPWERSPEILGLIIAGLDLAAVAVLAGVLHETYPTIGLLELLPVVIVSYSFGRAGLLVAIAGGVVVAFAPLITGAEHPSTPAAWVDLLISPLSVLLLAASLRYLFLLLKRSERRLRQAREVSNLAAITAENEQAVMVTVLDALDVGTAFVRHDDSVGFTNTAFRSLIARSVIDPVTRAGTKVYDTDRRTPVPPAQQMMEQAARGDYFDSRLYWVGDPGDQRAVLVTARPVIGHDGHLLGSAFVSKDVTELTDAIRAREDFLAGVSHELRTPLTSIIGYLEVIDDSIDSEASGIGRELGIIQRNANQLMMRIGDLLHVTDESLTLQRRVVEIDALARQAVDAIGFRAESGGVTLDLATGEAFTASVDPSRLAQVLDNLLTNAVKYTPPGGSVTVTLSRTTADFTIRVADTGSGIAAAELDRVFDRFYRAESVRGSAIAGVGLGLSIVRSIVQAHEGTIVVTSEPGGGTQFAVTIPFAH